MNKNNFKHSGSKFSSQNPYKPQQQQGISDDEQTKLIDDIEKQYQDFIDKMTKDVKGLQSQSIDENTLDVQQIIYKMTTMQNQYNKQIQDKIAECTKNVKRSKKEEVANYYIEDMEKEIDKYQKTWQDELDNINKMNKNISFLTNNQSQFLQTQNLSQNQQMQFQSELWQPMKIIPQQQQLIGSQSQESESNKSQLDDDRSIDDCNKPDDQLQSSDPTFQLESSQNLFLKESKKEKQVGGSQLQYKLNMMMQKVISVEQEITALRKQLEDQEQKHKQELDDQEQKHKQELDDQEKKYEKELKKQKKKQKKEQKKKHKEKKLKKVTKKLKELDIRDYAVLRYEYENRPWYDKMCCNKTDPMMSYGNNNQLDIEKKLEEIKSQDNESKKNMLKDYKFKTSFEKKEKYQKWLNKKSTLEAKINKINQDIQQQII